MSDRRNSVCLDCKCMRSCIKLADGWVCPECITARLAAAEAARGIAEQQLTVICDGVNRRCGKGPNELPLVSVDGVVKERDEFRQLLREVLRGRRRFMRDSLGKELYEAVEKAGGGE